MARTNVERNGSRGKRSRKDSGRNISRARLVSASARSLVHLKLRASAPALSAARRGVRDSRPARAGPISPTNARALNGDVYVWLPHDVLSRLNHLRGPGESYSDVVLRIVDELGG